MARLMATSTTAITLTLGEAGHAVADEPCALVEVSGDVSAHWRDAILDLREQIQHLQTSDCEPVRLQIQASEKSVRLIATMKDGRSAERLVKHPDSLVPTGLGLVMAIPPDSDKTRGPDPVAPPPAPGTEPRTPPAAAPPAPVAAPPHALALWGGLSSGLRLTGPTEVTVLDIEARLDLAIDRWLLLAGIRSALVSCVGQQGVDCDVYTDVSAGIGVGRRVPAGPATFDFALEPSMVAMHLEYDLNGVEGQTVQAADVELRIDASARLAVPVANHWFLTLTIDAGVAPALLVSPAHIDAPGGPQPSPAFPSWIGGLRLGAAGALL